LKHRIAFCAGLAALGVAATAATSAQAQTIPAEPPPAVEPGQPMAHPGLPPSEVLMIVRTSGLRPLTQPARQGPNWVLLASDNMGGQLRVLVSAQNGRIVHASPAHDPRFAYAPVRPRGLVPNAPPEHVGAPPPAAYNAPADLRTPTAPPPPRTARAAPAPQPPAAPSQNHGLAGAPDVTGSVPNRPARTPLPRPRPAMAANEANAAAPAAAAPAPVQARPAETSPEAETPAAAQPPAAAPSAAPAKPAPTETQMVPVAPLD
jgi:hypothetical protein